MEKQALLKVMNQPEEKLLLAKVLDQADFSLKKHVKIYTDFIDPGKCGKIEQILKKIPNLALCFFGGQADCERKMIGLAPDYMEFAQEDFPIDVLKITKNLKFSEELSHRDYLGSILGLGIDRSKIGDIILLEEYVICYVHKTITEYVKLNLNKVSHTKVMVEAVKADELFIPQKKVQYKTATVSSLRLDAVIGAAFQLSRAKAQSLIEGEKVNVNWSFISHVSFILKQGDIVSVRGYGRAELTEIKGKTRKDRISIVISRYV